MAWLSGFKKRVEITLDSSKISAGLANFPVYIHLSDSCGINAADISAVFDDLVSTTNKYKIAVTTSDGETQCYVEIDNMDFTNEEMGLHVKVPSISSSVDTILYFYWDPTASDNTTYVGALGEAAAQAVWDSTFDAVYHMAQDPSGGTDCIKDSTSNGYDLDTFGDMETADLVDHPPNGKAIHFTSGQYCQKTYSDSFSQADFTQEVYMRPASLGVTNYGMYLWQDPLGASYGSYIRQDSSNRSHAHGKPNNVNVNAYRGTVAIDEDQYFGHRRAGNTTTAFLNAASAAGNTKIGTSYTDDIIRIGNGSNYKIIEARLSNNDRTPAWMVATYYTLADNLLEFGLPEINFDNRIKLNIDADKIDSTLTDFPIMLKLGSAVGRNNEDLTEVFDDLNFTGDDFTGTDTDAPNEDLWEDAASDNPWEIQSNKIYSSLSSSEVGNLLSLFQLSGDFDIQIDFDSFTGGNASGLKLMVLDSDGSANQAAYIECFRTSSTNYWSTRYKTGGSWGSVDSVSRTNTYGKLRLVRSGSTVSAYYDDGGVGWTLHGSGTVGTNNLFVKFQTVTDASTSLTVNADNFVINSGDVVWAQGTDPNRKKIAVTTSNGTTQCYVEIEHWDGANEEAVLWVKIPSIGTTVHEVIYLYYDATADDNTTYVGDTGDTPAQNVWDDNFIAVYHLAQDPSGTAPQILDSTSNGNNLTSGGTMTSADLVAAEPGKGIEFDGADDHLTRTSSPISAYPFTLEAAGPAKVTATTNTNPSVSLADNSSSTDMFTLNVYDGYARALHSSTDFNIGTELLTDGVFVHLAAVHTSSVLHSLFTNGGDKITDTDSYAFPAGLDRLSIGSVQDSTAGYRAGKVSEVRISDIARTDAWIRATAETLNDNLLAVDHTFANSIKVTIDNTKVDSTLADFPVLIVLGENVGNNNKDLTEVFDDLTSDANNKKLKVVDSAGQELFVEIDYWDDASETAFLWVKVPSVSSSADTDIYLQYDVNAPNNISYVGDPGDDPAAKVWDDNFIIVQHGHASGTINSTEKITPTLPDMSTDDEITGQVGKALDFDGSNDDVNYGDSATARITPDISVEVVFRRATNPSSTEALTGKYSPSSPSEGWIVLMDADGYMNFDGREGGAYQSSGKISQDWADNAWHYVMGRKTSGGEWFIAADDHTYTSGNSGTGSGPIDANGSNLLVGQMSGVGGMHFAGDLDEVRISDTPRTNAWSKATYYTIFDNFLGFDAPDAPGGGMVLSTEGIHSSIFGGMIVR